MLGPTKQWFSKNKFHYDEINGIKYPTKSTIVDIHDFLIETFIKDGEVVHRGLHSDAVLSFSGIKYYMQKKGCEREDIIVRAAHIFNRFLEEGHPFVDGNKRTGFVTLWLFLILNGIQLNTLSFQYKMHLKKINRWADITEDDTISEIIMWIKNNSK